MRQVAFWADPAVAAQLVAERCPAEREETIRLAGEVCGNSFTFRGHWEMERTHNPVVFEAEIDWEHVPQGDPEWCYAFNRHSCLVTLGKAWRYTGDVRYEASFGRLIEDWIKNVPLTEDCRDTTWRPIEAGLRCESWLRALRLFAGSEVLDGALLGKIEASLRAHGDYLMESHGEFQRLSNWGVLQDHGLLLLGLYFEEDTWREEALRRLDEELNLQVLGDGTHWEQSPLYHCEVLHCALNAVLCCREAGVVLPPRFVHNTHAMARALAKMVRPDGLLLCQSDSDEVDARDLLVLAAALFEDASIKGYAGKGVYEENLWDIGDRLEGYEKLASAGRAGSVALGQSGNYMLWDGTGDDAGFAHMHCGSLGSGHGHADLLHVDLVANGETVLADSGRYTYVDGPLRRSLKSPEAHNCVRVDGTDFTQPTGSWDFGSVADPVKGSHHFTAVADHVSGAHRGYEKLGVLHRRRLIRLGEGLWVIWDSFTADPTALHMYEQYLHFGPTGTATPEDYGVRFDGERVSARLALAGAGCELLYSCASGSREYNELEYHDTLCAVHSGTGFRSLATVIATGPAGAPPELKVRTVPVTLGSAGKALAASDAQALRIECGDREWTLIVCHREVVDSVDLLYADGCAGYGRVIAFGPECPDGVTLDW